MSSAGGFRGLFTGFTRLSKGIAGVLATGYVVTTLVPGAAEALALVPGKSIPWIWNLVTAGYVERSLVNVVVSSLAVLFIGRTLEPIWGSKEFLKFVVVVNFCTVATTFAAMILLYSLTRNEEYLYDKICGFHGVVAGFLVAIKQLMPDQEITALFVLRFRAKHIPSLFVLASIILSVVSGDTVQLLPFVLFGTYSSWLYLRYFQTKSEGALKGDPSDDFAFATFFPEPLQPAIAPLANVFSKLCCGRRNSGDEESGHVLGGRPLPGSDPIEASRRRERGARALEERLAASLTGAAEGGDSSIPRGATTSKQAPTQEASLEAGDAIV